MSDAPNPAPEGAPPKKKGLPKNLIFLFVVIGILCLYILVNMLKGIDTFNRYQPDTENLTPASPGFP